MRKIIGILAMMLLIVLPLSMALETVIFNCTNGRILLDLFTDQENPTTNYGSADFLKFKDVTNEMIRHYIALNISSIPPGVIITEAVFGYYSYETAGAYGGDIHIHNIYDGAFDGKGEGTITWNTQVCGTAFNDAGDCNLTAADSQASVQNAYSLFNMAAIVKYHLSQGNDNVSLAIISDEDNGNNVGYGRSKEYCGTNPNIVIFGSVTYGDEIPPVVNVTYPPAYSFLDGVQYELYINGTASDDDDVINVVINNTLWGYNQGTNESFSFYVASVPDGNYTVNITAYDEVGNYAVFLLNFSVDTSYPVLTVDDPDNLTPYEDSIPYSLSCADNNPYRLNFTFYQDSTIYNSQQDMASPLSLSGSIDTSSIETGTYQMNITCSDSHTSSVIDEMDVVKDISNKEISFDSIKIRMISSTSGYIPIDILYAKLDDRYSFDFGSAVNQGTYTFEVSSPYYIDYLAKSPYKAHLVTGKYWLDFGLSDRSAMYAITRISPFKVRVAITASSLSFNSIGELNIVSSFYEVYVDHVSPNVTSDSPANDSVHDSNPIIFSCAASHTTPPVSLINLSIYLNSSVASVETVSGLTASRNLSIEIPSGEYAWYCEGCDIFGHCNLTSIYYLTQNITTPVIPSAGSEMSVSSCVFVSNNLVLALGVIFFFILAGAIIVMAKVFRHAIVGFIGSLILMLGSFFLVPCFALIGLAVTLLSFWVMWFFISRGWEGNL